jgi:hypothetical protein
MGAAVFRFDKPETMEVTERYLFRAEGQGKDFGLDVFNKPTSINAIYDYSASTEESYIGLWINYRFKSNFEN